MWLSAFWRSPRLALAQICDQTPPTNLTTPLPSAAGVIPASGDMAIGVNGDYLYVLTQWGIARVSLSNPSDPTGYNQVVVGKEGGSSVGIIPIVCDCHQGSSFFDIAENSDGSGTARMIEDWIPYTQGGPPPPNDPNHNFSGLPAQATMATGSGAPGFGQQIDLPDRVSLGGRVAAIYTGNGKYFGYLPVQSDNVYLADLSSPSGVPDYHNPIETSVAIGWQSGQTAVRMKAKHVSVPGYDKYILVGTTSDLVLHLAEINAATGALTEVASGAVVTNPSQMDIATVNGQIFIFAAEGAAGTQVLKYDPTSGTVSQVHLFSGNSRRVVVRGPQPFPGLFIHSGDASSSSIDVYDTKWLTEGGSPLHARSIPGFGSSDGAHYINYGFEVLVKATGSTLTAYLYRELVPPPPGLPDDREPDAHRHVRRLVHRGRPECAAGELRVDHEPDGAGAEPDDELPRRQVLPLRPVGLVRSDRHDQVGHQRARRLGRQLRRGRGLQRRLWQPWRGAPQYALADLLALRARQRRRSHDGGPAAIRAWARRPPAARSTWATRRTTSTATACRRGSLPG